MKSVYALVIDTRGESLNVYNVYEDSLTAVSVLVNLLEDDVLLDARWALKFIHDLEKDGFATYRMSNTDYTIFKRELETRKF